MHRSPALAGAAARLIQPFVDGRAPVTALGFTAISGPSEVWLLETLDSFALLEDVDRALSVEPLTPTSGFIAVYRPALSYRPEDAIKLFPRSRYLQVSINRIRPGAEADFAELMRIRRAGRDTINLDRPEIAYQVVSGIATPALRSVDALSQPESPRRRRRQVARLRGEGWRSGRQSPPADLYRRRGQPRKPAAARRSPQQFRLSEAFASGDPEFWRRQGREPIA